MNKYVNLHTNRVISESEYNSMDYFEQRRYRLVTSSDRLNDDGDFLLSVAIGAATDSAILGTILGGDVLGGVVGDILDGNLFD